MSVCKIDTDGDWTFGQNQANYINGSEEISQNVVTRLRSHRNDWFLNIGFGIPWFTILGNRNNEQTIKNEVLKTTLETQGVKSVEKVDIIKNTEREANIIVEYTDVFNQSFLREIGL